MVSCCVLGGSGFVGSRLVARLANAGHAITVPTRDPEHCRHLRLLPTVSLIHADINAPGVLGQLLRSTDVAINLVGILNEAGRDGAGFRRAHVELTRRLIEACGAVGVGRLIQVSALNAANPDTPAPATSHYLRSKGEAEALVRASGLRWTIFQPSVIFGPGDSFLNRFAGLLRVIPVAFPLAMPEARFSPVHVADVVEAIARALVDPATAGRTYQLCGPDTFTLRELVRMVAATLGLRRWIIGLPRPLSRLQAAVMDFVPGKPFSTDNYRSLLTDSVGSTDGLRQLGIEPRPLQPNLADTLGGAGLPGIRDSYRQQARR
ncbi:MAG: complex I NDUFA9 subunit family protein [Gammaproteobacteria bacterium]|nr:complex I NDUFA9 subunit family protein [Gammaproteobacteria bacterium]